MKPFSTNLVGVLLIIGQGCAISPERSDADTAQIPSAADTGRQPRQSPAEHEEGARDRQQFLEIAEQELRATDALGLATRDFVNALPEERRVVLARDLLVHNDPRLRSFALWRLIEMRREDHAADYLISELLGGADFTGYQWSWIHSGDDTVSIRMYLAIARKLLPNVKTLQGIEAERAKAYLRTGGLLPALPSYSDKAIVQRIEESRRVLQAIEEQAGQQ